MQKWGEARVSRGRQRCGSHLSVAARPGAGGSCEQVGRQRPASVFVPQGWFVPSLGKHPAFPSGAAQPLF